MRYLVCGLNSFDYAYPDFSLVKTRKDAILKAVEFIINFVHYPEIEISQKHEKIRVAGADADDKFYVAEIFLIDEIKTDSILIWHHGYEGVDFEILFKGTMGECEEEYGKVIKKLEEEYGESTQGVVDTGSEWEVFTILNISDLEKE